jgi:hypothetical protein
LFCRRCAHRRDAGDADESAAGRSLFRDTFRAFFELKVNFRSGGDETLARALNCAARGVAPSARTLARLNARVVSEKSAARRAPADALWTSPYRKTVKALNDSALLSGSFFDLEPAASGCARVSAGMPHATSGQRASRRLHAAQGARDAVDEDAHAEQRNTRAVNDAEVKHVSQPAADAITDGYLYLYIRNDIDTRQQSIPQHMCEDIFLEYVAEVAVLTNECARRMEDAEIANVQHYAQPHPRLIDSARTRRIPATLQHVSRLCRDASVVCPTRATSSRVRKSSRQTLGQRCLKDGKESARKAH